MAGLRRKGLDEAEGFIGKNWNRVLGISYYS